MYAYILLLIFSILSVKSFLSKNLKDSIEFDTLVFELILNAEKSNIISYELYKNQRYLKEAKQLDLEFLKNNLEKFVNYGYSPTIFSINQSIEVARLISLSDLMLRNILYLSNISDIKVINLDIPNSRLNETNLNLQSTLTIRGGGVFKPNPLAVIKEPSKIKPLNKIKKGIHISSVVIMLLACLQVAVLLENAPRHPVSASKINIFKYTLEDVVGPISHRLNFFKIFSRIFSNRQTLDAFLLSLKNQGVILNPVSLFNLCLNLFFNDIIRFENISGLTSIFLVGPAAAISYLSFKNDNAHVVFYAFFTAMLFDIFVTWLNPNYYYKLFFIYLRFWYFIVFMSWSEICAMSKNGNVINVILDRISKIIKWLREMSATVEDVKRGEYKYETPQVVTPEIQNPYKPRVRSIEMPLMDVHDNLLSKIRERLPIIDAEFVKDNDVKSLNEYPLNQFFEIEKVVDKIFTEPLKTRK